MTRAVGLYPHKSYALREVFRLQGPHKYLSTYSEKCIEIGPET